MREVFVREVWLWVGVKDRKWEMGNGKWERQGSGRTDFRSDFCRQMYRNQRFSSSWILEGMLPSFGERERKWS